MQPEVCCHCGELLSPTIAAALRRVCCDDRREAWDRPDLTGLVVYLVEAIEQADPQEADAVVFIRAFSRWAHTSADEVDLSTFSAWAGLPSDVLVAAIRHLWTDIGQASSASLAMAPEHAALSQ